MATTAQIRDAQRKLRAAGFPAGPVDGKVGPKTRAGVLAFQTAWLGGFGSAPGVLARTGGLNAPTLRAIGYLPRLSRHFSAREVWCKHCHRAYIRREALAVLERYRARVGAPVTPISAYRCPTHNRRVGGATDSQHKYGRAFDVRPVLSVPQVRALGATGIGWNASTNRVAHLDVRPQAHTTIWRYGR